MPKMYTVTASLIATYNRYSVALREEFSRYLGAQKVPMTYAR